MASSYHGEPQEEEDTFEYHIQDDFDASILTPAQLVMLYELQKEYPGSAKTSLARRIRLELIKDRAELEGREVTKYEFNVAYDLKEVMDWAPPLQLEEMASSYHGEPQEEEDTFEYHIQDDFDASILTPAQLVMLYELQKEYPGSAKTSLARRIRLELIKDRAELEGREVTKYEFNVAYDLKEVMDWAPPLQLEGIEISILELQFEKICLPCGENIAHDHDSLVLINECLDMICETRKLDELRIEKLARVHIEVCFDKSYLCASFDLESEFLILNEPRPLLSLADIGDELDVDKLLLEIENPLVKNNHENVNIVFYSVDGDRVDYFVKTSFEPVVDFIFPPNAFDSHDYLNIKEHLIFHDSSIVKLFDEKSVYFLWTVVCSFAHLVSCSCRRMTKGALAQPFDTYD
ncbi:uncharacterized protein LOC130496901 [Raphanus sativus]|uniref:Uncharacterized protein LOC130496901 n=1 Tax=Raphanus sativus TaxID=3726 RepID=A0A9W3C1Y9_RAPSA|nr:uncharacterized protein LOC130496901 [Raphanus sativus]